MKLVGNVKKEVEKAEDRNEAKAIIRNAGMELTEEEPEMVTGGMSVNTPKKTSHSPVTEIVCKKCGRKYPYHFCHACGVCGGSGPENWDLLPLNGKNPYNTVNY